MALRLVIFFLLFYFFHSPDVLCQQKKATIASFDDLFSDLPIDDPSSRSVLLPGETAEQKINNQIFVSGILNKSSCYIGEPVLLDFELLSALKSTSSVKAIPEISNVLMISMNPDNEFPRFRKKNGISFGVFIVKQLQLIPGKTGEIQIGSIRVTNEVNYINDNKTYSYSGDVFSKPISINVKPLPTYGVPKGFSGIVGDFSIQVSIEKDSFSVGQNNKLFIEIDGKGNFYSLVNPIVPWPVGFEVFEPTEKVTVDEQQFPVAGNKVISIPFIVQRAGEYSIPSFEISFFDPGLNKYRRSVSSEIHLSVYPSVQQSASKLSITDNRNTIWRYLLLFFIAGTAIVFCMKKIRSLLLKREKVRTFKRQQQEAEEKNQAEQRKRINQVYAAIGSLAGLEINVQYIPKVKAAFIDYLHLKFNTYELLPEELLRTLSEKDRECSNEAKQLMDECDTLIYSGVLPAVSQCEGLNNLLKDLVEKIDRIA